jgi:hypothetical protein
VFAPFVVIVEDRVAEIEFLGHWSCRYAFGLLGGVGIADSFARSAARVGRISGGKASANVWPPCISRTRAFSPSGRAETQYRLTVYVS